MFMILEVASLDARVSSVLIDGHWAWPLAWSDFHRVGCLLLIILVIRILRFGSKKKMGSILALKTWDCLRTKFLEVSWCHVVWFPLAIPRHAFILWLIFRGALVTNDRICWWGFEGNTLCRFCYGGQESIAHLFFHCSFCRRIWRHLMSLCLVQKSCIEWDDIARWSCTLKGRGLQVLLYKLCLAVAVNHLWRLRNDLCHVNTPWMEEAFVAQI
jgi:hypothetical protein